MVHLQAGSPTFSFGVRNGSVSWEKVKDAPGTAPSRDAGKRGNGMREWAGPGVQIGYYSG